MSTNDPAEALRQIKAQWEGPSDWPRTDQEWAQLYVAPLLAVAEAALEYDDWFGAGGAQTDLFAISLRLHEALKRLGQSRTEEGAHGD